MQEPDPVPATLAEVYASKRLSLVRLAMVLVDDRETGEDIVQDVFAKLSRGPAGRLASAPSSEYLRRAVLNTARSALRRRRVRRSLTRSSEAHAPPADELVTRASDRAVMMQQLDRLPRRQREVLVLRYFEDLGTAEIARTLGISTSAVSSSESLGLKKLNNFLGQRHD